MGDQKAISNAGGVIRIDDSRVDVDAWRIELLAAEKGDQGEAAEAAIELYYGSFVDLYSGHTDLAIYREHLAQKIESLILRAGKNLMVREEWDRAAAVFEKGLERFGFHEEFLFHLKGCFKRAGRNEALRRANKHWEAEQSEFSDFGLFSFENSR